MNSSIADRKIMGNRLHQQWCLHYLYPTERGGRGLNIDVDILHGLPRRMELMAMQSMRGWSFRTAAKENRRNDLVVRTITGRRASYCFYDSSCLFLRQVKKCGVEGGHINGMSCENVKNRLTIRRITPKSAVFCIRTEERMGDKSQAENDFDRFYSTDSFRPPQNLNTLEDAKEYWKNEKRKKHKKGPDTNSCRHTYKSRLNLTWKRERLHVADDWRLPGNSMTDDIDPEFFKMVSGRPLKGNKNIGTYVKDIRNCFLTRLNTGFHLDEILLINESQAGEMRRLQEVRGNFMEILKRFEDFLKEDHLLSRNLLSTVRLESEKSAGKLSAVERLRETLKVIETDILGLEEEWRKCKMFQGFLYLTAPSDWRKSNDPNYGKCHVEGSVSDPCLFDRFREFPGTVTWDIQSKVSRFIDDVKHCEPPKIFFTDPQQIHVILAELEKNNLRALNHCKELDFPAANAMAETEKVKTRLEKDQAKLEEDIRFLQDLVKREEKKAAESEESLREMVYGIFRARITNEEYLSTAACLEDAYEDAVGSTDTDLDPLNMIKEIESKWESLLLALDGLPKNLAIVNTRLFYKRQKRELEEAKEAEKKVHQMERLMCRLGQALEGPRKSFKERKMTPRSRPPEEQLGRREKHKILTQDQMNQMFLFGEPTETDKIYRPLCI